MLQENLIFDYEVLRCFDRFQCRFVFTKVTSQIVAAIMEAQKIDFVEGDAIPVPGTEEKVVLPRKLTLAELTRFDYSLESINLVSLA